MPVLRLTAHIRYLICHRSPGGCGANAAEAVSIGQAIARKVRRWDVPAPLTCGDTAPWDGSRGIFHLEVEAMRH